MKLRIFLTLITFVAVASSAWGVTREEMEQARTITAQAFLRYMNNGSDYLDKLDPVRVSDLKNSLKTKEKENIKIFESIEYPKIEVYSQWSKDDLLKYWGTDFWNDSRIPAHCKGARVRVKSKIGAMNVGAVATESQETTTALAETDNAASEAQRVLDSIKMADSIAAEAAILAASEVVDETFDTAVANAEALDEPADDAPRSKKSSTWLYAAILLVLVVAVVVLVVYAVKSVKKAQMEDDDADDNGLGQDSAPDRRQSVESVEASMYERIIADKEAEIQTLRDENQALRDEIDHIKSVLNQLRYAPNAEETTPMTAPVRPSRTIYLAYANAKGMFVRADSRYNEDYSIFKLVTTDGVTGSFSIVDNASAHKLALSLPSSVLSNTCICEDMQHGNWARRIVTEREGTAVFENGRWMVMRKTEINFE